MGKVIAVVVAGLLILGWLNSGEQDKKLAAKEEKEQAAASTVDSNEPQTSQPSKPEPPPEPPSPWRVNKWTSQMDDSPAVSLTSSSDSIYTGAYGGAPGPATLHLRCLENETNLFIKLNGHFLADIQSYGKVTYRIDDQQARTVRMAESTNNKALGLWSGGQAIPVIRRMLNHDQVTMRVTPYNQSPETITFPIDRIEEDIKPLRTACHW